MYGSAVCDVICVCEVVMEWWRRAFSWLLPGSPRVSEQPACHRHVACLMVMMVCAGGLPVVVPGGAQGDGHDVGRVPAGQTGVTRHHSIGSAISQALSCSQLAPRATTRDPPLSNRCLLFAGGREVPEKGHRLRRAHARLPRRAGGRMALWVCRGGGGASPLL